MKKSLRLTFATLLYIVFLMYPSFALAEGGEMRSSSGIPDLKLQIPIDKITGAGSNQLQSSGTDQGPKVNLPVERLSSIAGAELEKGSGLSTYVSTMYQWIAGALSMVAVLFIMIGGLIWLTAAGSSKSVTLAKKFIFDSLGGLAIVLGSYLMLSTLNKDLVDLRIIGPGSTVGSTSESGGIASGGTVSTVSAGAHSPAKGKAASISVPSPAGGKTASASGKTTSGGEWNSSGTVWVSNMLKERDAADVLYYFHGIKTGGGRDCTGTNNTRETMQEGGVAFTVIKNMIANGSIEPIVIVVSDGGQKGLNNSLSKSRAEAKKFLTGKKISIASESIAGHSNGGVIIAKEWNANLKYIGLIDPWVVKITDSMINQKKDLIIYNYNRRSWGGYEPNKKRLEEIGAKNMLNQPESSTKHCALVAEHMKRLTKYFKK